MGYRVEIFTIQTGIFGTVKSKKMVQLLAEKLNDLDEKGYEVISVVPLLNKSKDFEYQIISKKIKTEE